MYYCVAHKQCYFQVEECSFGRSKERGSPNPIVKCVTVLEELKIQAMNDGGIGTVQYLSRYGLFVDNLNS